MLSLTKFEDIKRLVIEKVEEGQYIEFKEKIKRNDLVKEVVAFANADGGTLIIGIKEDNGKASKLSPLENERGIKERYSQIIESNTNPNIKDYEIDIIDDPEKAGVYVVITVNKSPNAPHMDTISNKYYIRRGNRSIPMLDNEVRMLLFKRGVMENLLIEISSNIDIAHKAVLFVDEKLMRVREPEKRKPAIFVPLKNEAWKSFLQSGLIHTASAEIVSELIEVYNLIYEINSLIEMSNLMSVSGKEPFITTPVDSSEASEGTYTPMLIRNKMDDLERCLDKLKEKLELVLK